MADLKIYNNGENKILMSAGDRIIRQPYEFDNAFVNAGGLNSYIEVDGIGASLLSLSVMQWYYMPVFPEGGTRLSLFNIQAINSDNICLQYIDASTGIWYGPTYNSDLTFDSMRVPKINMGSVTGSNNLQSLILNNGFHTSEVRKNAIKYTRENLSAFNFPDNDVLKIWVGAGRRSNGSTPDIFSHPSVRLGRIIVYNREFVESERIFYHNNGIGNDPQSVADLFIDIRNDKAEILTIGGVQKVGVRDYSGNNHHGEIMNLPAGTLQEQLDWANANLFVPFIS